MNTKLNIKNFVILGLLVLIVIFAFAIFFLIMSKENREQAKTDQITNFEQCVAAGYPIMESYPRQCSTPAGNTYTEELSDFDETIVGGDVDEHGCLGSAGYSWCQPKDKCLRIWEEACYENLKQEIQYQLADKYNKSVDQVQISLTKETDQYASGSVKFSDEDQVGGGLFLAVKIDNLWSIVYDGNGSVDCLKLRQQYGFPDEILKPNFCD